MTHSQQALFVRCAAAFCAMLGTALAHLPAEAATRVLVIGVDGLAPAGIQQANTPILDQLIASGAKSFTARGVMPTVSAPNWMSMITGAGPEQHGVINNPPWKPNEDRFDSVLDRGTRGIKMFPTIFGLIRDQRPTLTSALVHDWDGFGILIERAKVNTIVNGNDEDHTTAEAIRLLHESKPEFLFVHLDHVDHALHDIGFLSPEYLAAVEKTDRLIGEILAALETAGLRKETVVIITADHGGKNKGHGGNTLAEITIPWIIQGPGVRTGKNLDQVPINTYDTAATIAHLLGIALPRAAVGRPVLEAFE